MTAPTFATTDALNAHAGATFDTARAQQALAEATSVIQAWTGQWLFLVVAESITLDPTDTGSIFLPELPVTDVISVKYLDCNSVWQTLDPTSYRWNSRGRIYLTKVVDYWPLGLDTIQVTYTHGYSVIPDTLATVCVQLAARIIANPYDAADMSTGGVRMRFSGTLGTDRLKETEKYILGRYSLTEVS